MSPTPRPRSFWAFTLVALVVLLALHPLVARHASAYAQRVIILAGINVTLAVSLNVINGVTGQFSIGHAGFMAVGAYVGAALTVFGGTWLEAHAAHGQLDPARPLLNLFLLTSDGQAPGWSVNALAQAWFALTLLASGLAAALCGFVVGLPTLRLRGDYLAIATLGFSEIVRVVLLNIEKVGGASGFTGAPPFNQIPSYTNFLNVYLTALVCVCGVTALQRSSRGRALIAVREDEVAAEAVGIDTTYYKVRAFAFSAFFAGVAGGLLAHYLKMIIPTPTMFGFLRSIEVIAMVVLGGSGSTTGCVLAAVVLTVLPERLRDLDQWRMVLYAEILLVMMLVRRQGLLGSRELTSGDWRRWASGLRARGLRGVLHGVGQALAVRRAAWTEHLWRAGQGRLTGWVAWLVAVLPLVDVLLFAPALVELLLTGGAGRWWRIAGAGTAADPIHTCAAGIVSSLTALAPQAMRAVPALAPLAGDLQLPLAADAGLSLALLPLWIAWWALVSRLANGERRAAWWVALVLAATLWHGGGMLCLGRRDWRSWAEAGAAGLALALLALWRLRDTGRRR
jgi:branched-chain amino acid transport system permease protein